MPAVEDPVQKLRELLAISKRVHQDQMRRILNLDIDAFNARILEWAYQFGLELDGEYVNISTASVSDFARGLDAQFKAWEENIQPAAKEKGQLYWVVPRNVVMHQMHVKDPAITFEHDALLPLSAFWTDVLSDLNSLSQGLAAVIGKILPDVACLALVNKFYTRFPPLTQDLARRAASAPPAQALLLKNYFAMQGLPRLEESALKILSTGLIDSTTRILSQGSAFARHAQRFEVNDADVRLSMQYGGFQKPVPPDTRNFMPVDVFKQIFRDSLSFGSLLSDKSLERIHATATQSLTRVLAIAADIGQLAKTPELTARQVSEAIRIKEYPLKLPTQFSPVIPLDAVTPWVTIHIKNVFPALSLTPVGFQVLANYWAYPPSYWHAQLLLLHDYFREVNAGHPAQWSLIDAVDFVRRPALLDTLGSAVMPLQEAHFSRMVLDTLGDFSNFAPSFVEGLRQLVYDSLKHFTNTLTYLLKIRLSQLEHGTPPALVVATTTPLDVSTVARLWGMVVPPLPADASLHDPARWEEVSRLMRQQGHQADISAEIVQQVMDTLTQYLAAILLELRNTLIQRGAVMRLLNRQSIKAAICSYDLVCLETLLEGTHGAP